MRFLTDPSLEAAGKVIATIGHARDDRGKVRLTLKFSISVYVDDDNIDDIYDIYYDDVSVCLSRKMSTSSWESPVTT